MAPMAISRSDQPDGARAHAWDVRSPIAFLFPGQGGFDAAGFAGGEGDFRQAVLFEAGGGDGEGVVVEVGHAQVAQQQAPVGVGVGAHPPITLWR